MTKWIAIPAAALLCAALARPRPEPPLSRRPPPAAVEALPVESPTPPPFLDALAGTLLPSTSVVRPNQESPHRRIVWEEVARLLEQAYAAIYDERYLRAVGACEEILRIDPHYGVAEELLTLALRLRHIQVGDKDSIYRAIEPWVVRTNDDPVRPSIPCPETFRLPSADDWERIRWPLFGTNDSARLDDSDPTIEAIHRKLETMRIDLDFENTKLEDILAFIRDFSGLNIILDAAVRGHVEPDKAITFKVKDLVLKNVLKLLLSQFQLDYFVTEERVVLLSDYRRPAMQEGGRDLVAMLTPSPPDPLVGIPRIDLDLTDTPLWRVAELLQAMTGLPIRVVHAGDDPVSLKVQDADLRTALELLLKPRDMVFAWEAGELQIRARIDPDRY